MKTITGASELVHSMLRLRFGSCLMFIKISLYSLKINCSMIVLHISLEYSAKSGKLRYDLGIN